MTQEKSPVVCKMCAMHLIRQCYREHWWFRLVREPLVWGMRILAWGNGIDARTAVANKDCHGCVRFMKAELEEKSPTFIFLNKYIGPRFRPLRDSMLTQKDFVEGKRYAKEAMETKNKK